jgi:PTS system nitrogen regulatory IIA component
MKIADILSVERVVLGADVASKKGVLEALAGLLAGAQPGLNRQKIFDSLLARERLGTTGLGAGIAIPHGRVVHSGTAAAAFMRSATAVDFNAVDNAPVDLFFALCVPEAATAEHLELLSELARLFSNAQFVSTLRRSESSAEVYALLTGGDGASRPVARAP